MGFVSSVEEHSEICFVTKIKDDSSRSGFAKSIPSKHGAVSEELRKSMEYKPRNCNSTIEMLVFDLLCLTFKYTVLPLFQVGPPLMWNASKFIVVMFIVFMSGVLFLCVEYGKQEAETWNAVMA